MTARRTFARVMAVLLALSAALVVALYLVVKTLLAPLPGEWATSIRLGPVRLQASVPALLRLATAPWLAPLLDGRTVAAYNGPVHLAWQADSQTLAARCAPCAVQAPALGGEPVEVDELRLTIQRHGEQLNGEISSGQVKAVWHGDLTKGGLRLRLQLPMTPMADAYALFGASIPELAQARIEGRLALTATLALPGGEFSMTPQIEAFQVSGLGTEALVNARSACSDTASRLTPESWLARAVIAAEDQRFYEHGGYDLAELSAALVQNQDSRPEGRAGRGASTLTQQLAKLLVTGDERSPARKLRELLYAVEMEQTLGKNRILRLYLAHAPWGNGICGAEAASKRYFGRPATALNPSQAAWLAAMLHNPALEAEHWASTGQINVARTQWVLMGMRALPRQQRQRLARQLGEPGHEVWKAQVTKQR
ncbi:glycosyl transferase, family 51 [Polaromonas naphthalenivorans CJ2]|uniref:Glycosyl transferase, family 51 n=1 Tax=Polaromonas naphthalenivorans (strain CJ2) TaxID=365044 RepID=A1VI73_POLNA|nr:glycosyl transferase, family 51 [Polaromonas naphthalenivorans CJ2]